MSQLAAMATALGKQALAAVVTCEWQVSKLRMIYVDLHTHLKLAKANKGMVDFRGAMVTMAVKYMHEVKVTAASDNLEALLGSAWPRSVSTWSPSLRSRLVSPMA